MNPLVSPYIGGAGGVAGLSGASGGTAIADNRIIRGDGTLSLELLSTILVSTLALTDVVLTYLVLRKHGYEKEQSRLIKWIYKKAKKAAPFLHAALYAAFISIPWIFVSKGVVLGNLILSAIIAYAVKNNLKEI